ncbi:MAG: tRNA (guanosine(46)-N7)-methyltransferase TrmB [Defluviitaleaceae bacterium]|nr:tRNA (guanosine(46)-N7)-methyltransferase TrmB [Defluviitaleaceae bacterium]
MRARRKSWAAHEIETNPFCIETPDEHAGRWHEFFDNSNPIHLEIGCGMGRYITHMAEANPDVNFIAFERERNVIVTGARAARESGRRIAFIIGDASDLSGCFTPGEISRIYINFPDPWPNRKKWRKRRLTHSSFLQTYKRVMGASGEIFHKTDNAELFEFSLEQFSQHGFALRNISLDLHKSSFAGNIMTEYESKFSAQNLPIYRCEAFYNKGVPHVEN